MKIARYGLNVYVVWADRRDGARDVRVDRSLDGGATWLAADVRLDTDTAGDEDSWDPEIACSGSTVHVVWRDNAGGGNHVFYSRSADAGATWLPTNAQLATRLNDVYVPRIVCDGLRVYAVWVDNGATAYGFWVDNRTDTFHVRFKRSVS